MILGKRQVVSSFFHDPLILMISALPCFYISSILLDHLPSSLYSVGTFRKDSILRLI